MRRKYAPSCGPLAADLQPDFFNDDVRRETDKARVIVKPHHPKLSPSVRIWAVARFQM
jgi:hypothetical protein